MTVFTLAAKQDHLEKVAKTSDPIKAISEFVWNALDAEATKVSVEFELNVLGGLQDIVIRDNGIGITPTHAATDFKSLGNSWKKTAVRKKGQRALHGQEGKGRLQFFSLAEKAHWQTTYSSEDKLWDLSIDISANLLEQCNVSEKAPSVAKSTGTIVTLSPLKATHDWLTSNNALAEFSARFAPYLMQYSGISIAYNGHDIDPSTTIFKSHDFHILLTQLRHRIRRYPILMLGLRITAFRYRCQQLLCLFSGFNGSKSAMLP
jgi:hypothetical protein